LQTFHTFTHFVNHSISSLMLQAFHLFTYLCTTSFSNYSS
jgi:hypothetical protein